MQVCCHYRNTTFCICAFYSLNCVSVSPIFCFLSFVINGRLISPTHKALCDLCAKIRIFQNHTKWIFKGSLFLRVHQCDCVADKQATQLALGIKQRTDHWLDQSQCAIEVFCKVLTHTFSLRLCACAWTCPAYAVAYDPLISALSCTASRDTLTPTSTELWPHTFLPRALRTPSLRPSHSSRPASPSPSSLSFFCVSTDVWNYSGMEGWIPPWWAEQRREPFVQ